MMAPAGRLGRDSGKARLETTLSVDAPTLSRLEQASFRYAVAAVLSDHRQVSGGRVEASLVLYAGARRADCSVEVALATGDVLTVWASDDDLFVALEVCLRSLGQQLRALLRAPRRTNLADVA